MSDMKFAEAAEVLKRDDVSQSARAEAIEVALRALGDVAIQARVIVRQSQEIKAMRKAMNGQSEFAYMGGDLISREALIERMENVDWYSTNDKGVLHTGAADQESAYVRWKDVAEVMESALAVEAVPVEVIRKYLVALVDEWHSMGDRAYELPNVQVYNHVRKCLDDLDAYCAHMDEVVADGT